MSNYTQNLRQQLINKNLHVNDDVSSTRPGYIDRDYDFEEHEQYI